MLITRWILFAALIGSAAGCQHPTDRNTTTSAIAPDQTPTLTAQASQTYDPNDVPVVPPAPQPPPPAPQPYAKPVPKSDVDPSCIQAALTGTPNPPECNPDDNTTLPDLRRRDVTTSPDR